MADQREDRSEASQEVLMESQLVPAPIAKVRLMTDARRAGLAGRADSSRDCLGWKAAGVSDSDASAWIGLGLGSGLGVGLGLGLGLGSGLGLRLGLGLG